MSQDVFVRRVNFNQGGKGSEVAQQGSNTTEASVKSSQANCINLALNQRVVSMAFPKKKKKETCNMILTAIVMWLYADFHYYTCICNIQNHTKQLC